MKNKEFDISQRAGKQTVDEMTYALGLLDIVDFLFVDMQQLLKEENRCFGIVKSYIHSISEAYRKINEGVGEDKIEIYGKILYLFKPLLRKEYKRLVERRLSPADADIGIMRKILSIIEEVPDFVHKRELKTIKKVIDKLWENIRNRSKKDNFFNLANQIKTYMSKGQIGKHPLDQFTLKVEEKPKEILTGDPTRLLSEGTKGKKILEVGL